MKIVSVKYPFGVELEMNTVSFDNLFNLQLEFAPSPMRFLFIKSNDTCFLRFQDGKPYLLVQGINDERCYRVLMTIAEKSQLKKIVASSLDDDLLNYRSFCQHLNPQRLVNAGKLLTLLGDGDF